MTGDVPSGPNSTAPTTVAPRAPGNRVSPGFLVALVVAALMLLGIVGLVGAAVLGDDDDPTGSGLGPQVNVDAPATAPPVDASASSGPESSALDSNSGAVSTVASSAEPGDAAVTAGAGGSAPVAGDSAGSPPSGDDDFSDDPSPSITTVAGIDDIEPPDAGELPEPSDGPVLLPVQVTAPAVPSTFPAVPLGDVSADSVSALDGWSEHDRSTDHVAFTRDNELLEIFVIDGVATADEALEAFYDDVRPELEELNRSAVARLGAPTARFLAVAGSEYIATTARQQGTSTMSGAIVAAVRADGTAVVLTTSRGGESSANELTTDAELLTTILAHL